MFEDLKNKSTGFLGTLTNAFTAKPAVKPQPFYPTPTGAPITKKPDPVKDDFITTLTKNIGVSNLPVPKISTPTPIINPNKKYGDVVGGVVNLARTPFQAVAQAAYDTMSTVQKQPLTSYQPTNKFEKFFLGSKPLKTGQDYINEYKVNIEKSKQVGTPSWQSVPLALLGTLGEIAGNATGLIGGEKKIAENLFKDSFDDLVKFGTNTIKTEEHAVQVLKEVGLSDDIAKIHAPRLAVSKTAEETKVILKDAAAEQIQRTQKLAQARLGVLDEQVKKGEVLNGQDFAEYNFLKKNKNNPEALIGATHEPTIINKTSQGVVESKFPDRTINLENQRLYHGTDQVFDLFDGSKNKSGTYSGIHLTDTPEAALAHGDTLKEADIKGKFFDLGSSTDETKVIKALGTDEKGLQKMLEQEGYDGVKRGTEYVAFKDKVVNEGLVPKLQERGFITSIKKSPQIKAEVQDAVKGEYGPISNQQTLEKAQKAVQESPEAALADVLQGTVKDADYTAKALVLIQKAQAVGDFTMAARIAETAAEKLTEAGQMIQAASMLNRLTPEGILVYAARRTGKPLTTELVSKLTDQAKKVRELPNGYQKFKETQKLGEIISHEIPRTLGSKAKDWLTELINLPRSLASSFFDFSFGLRQGVVAGPSFPKEFAGAFKAQFKPFASEKGYEELMDSIITHPKFELASKSGVAFSDINLKLNAREEKYMSSWAERIPIIKIPVRATNRAYTAMANKLRMDTFSTMIDNFEAAGLNPLENKKLLADTASFINDLTGRGALPDGIKGAANMLNGIFYSPRLMASRLNLLANPVKYINQSPAVRKQALKSMLAFGATVTGVLGLASLHPDVKVETDPRSADWGKIKIGNTRIDIMGGFQQYIRMAAQLISGKYVNSATGKVSTLGEGYKPMTRKDILLKGLESKESPLFSFITSVLTGQDFDGNKINVAKEAGKRFIPMLASDLYDLYKDNPKLLPLGIGALFGTGLQTYGPPEAYSKLNEINALPANEQAVAFDKLKAENPILAQKVKTAKREETFTEDDWDLTYLGVENGDRAKFLYEQFKKLPNNEARAARYEDLRTKKLISDKVDEQFKYLLANDGKIPK